jgi:hypothetical protein
MLVRICSFIWERSIARGETRPFGSSPFYWNLLSTAQAVLTSIDGGQPTERPPTADAGIAHERISRVQAIKCSPLLEASSRLPAGMTQQCPPCFAVSEIELLRPGVLVAMGDPALSTFPLAPALDVHLGSVAV